MKTYREPTIGYEIGMKIRDIISFIYHLAVDIFTFAAVAAVMTCPWWLEFLIEHAFD